MKRTLLLTLLTLYFFTACQKKAGVRPQMKDITEAVFASGMIVPKERYVVSSVMSGQIIALLVKEGDSVTVGQPLVRIQNQTAQASTQASQARMNYARITADPNAPVIVAAKESLRQAMIKLEYDSVNYVRYQNLFRQQAVSRQMLENMESAYKLSRQSVAVAQNNLENLKKQLQTEYEVAYNQYLGQKSAQDEYLITAKISGRVLRIDKKDGELVLPQVPIMEIGGGGEYIAEVLVDESDILKVKTGQEVWLKAEAQAEAFNGRVHKIYPAVATANKTVKVEVTLSRSIPVSGLSLEANIITDRKKGAMVIPRAYLLAGDSVQVLQEGKVVKHKVQTGLKDLEYVEILSGLNQDQEILP